LADRTFWSGGTLAVVTVVEEARIFRARAAICGTGHIGKDDTSSGGVIAIRHPTSRFGGTARSSRNQREGIIGRRHRG